MNDTRYALLIGVSDYAGELSSLPAAKRDIVGVHNTLRTVGKFREENITQLDSPSTEECRQKLGQLFRQRKPGDTVLFYYSGHALTNESGKRTYLCSRTTTADTLEADGVSSDFLSNLMGDCRAQQVVILDCCFSSAVAKDIHLNRNAVILASSNTGEYSRTGEGLSTYTECLLKGIEADIVPENGQITASMIQKHVEAAVTSKQVDMRPQIWPFKNGYNIPIAWREPPSANPKPNTQHLPAYHLTIELSRQKNHLTRIYHIDNARKEYRSNWADAGKVLSDCRSLGMAALREPALGEKLFALLFGEGDDDCSGQILQQLLHRKAEPTPISDPVRIRLQTQDPCLLNLPWRQTCWQGILLLEHGWSFEHVRHLTEDAMITLRLPEPLLYITDEAEQNHHALGFEEIIDRHWVNHPDLLQRGDDEKQIHAVLASRYPACVYYCGQAERIKGQLHLQLADQSTIALSTLAQAWQKQPPKVVFLNLVNTTLLSNHASDQQALDGVALTIVQPTVNATLQDAKSAAIRWFGALYQSTGEVDPNQFLAGALASASAFSAYHNWTILSTPAVRQKHQAKLLLDRTNQRARVRKVLDELLREPDRRVCCVLGCGDESNHMNDFAGQMFKHLHDNADDIAHITKHRVTLPPQANFDYKHVETQLRQDWGLSEHTQLQQALLAKKPRIGDARSTVLVLDWQVRGGRFGDALGTETLRAWLNFCCHRLAKQCPDGMRMLAFLAIETEKPDAVQAVAKGLRSDNDFRDRAFRLEIVPTLGKVSLEDLADHLDSGATSCPDALLRVMPELIMAKTGGVFDATVAEFDRAEAVGWYALKDELTATVGTLKPSAVPKNVTF